MSVDNISHNNNDNALNAASFILVFMFGSGLITNSMVLRVFFYNRKLFKPINFFTIVLASVNWLNTFIHVPFLIAGVTIKG
jgi:hypothetical protein